MREKKYSGAPFGTQTARFDVAGIHPKSKAPGTYTQIAYITNTSSLGPGAYQNPLGAFTERAMTDAALGPGWARQYEVEKIAAMPHLLHRDQWEHKRELSRRLGPGTYTLKDSLHNVEEKPRSSIGVCGTRDSRFKEQAVADVTPGPGTYGEGGIPHSSVEKKSKISPGNKGLLQNGASDLRATKQTGSHLAPGTYNFESFTDTMNKRVVSVRGPYDLFSEDRNEGIISGHFAKPKLADLGPGQYHFASFTDDVVKHKYKGRISRLPQQPKRNTERIHLFSLAHRPRDPQELAPGEYDPRDLEKPLTQGQNLPPFLTSAKRDDKLATKFFTGNYNQVGPGRYDFKRMEDAHIHRDGHTHHFKSTSGRLSNNQMQAWQERLRAKDIRPQDRLFLVDPESPAQHLNRAKSHMEQSMAPYRATQGQRATTMVC